jgi:putative hemolysin
MKVRKPHEPPVTEEKIKILFEEGTKAGMFEKAELSMIEGVLEIGDLRVDSLMTHRNDITAIDLEYPINESLRKIIGSGRSSFPAYEEVLDNIIGMISVRKVLEKFVESGTVNFKELVTQLLVSKS